MNAPMSFGHRQLGPLVAAFRRQYPGIYLELVLADRMVDMVEEGFDVTIRITRPSDSSLVARRVAPCRFSVVASPAYLEKWGRPQSAADLVDHHCLVYRYAPEPERWRFQFDGEPRVVAVSGNLCANNGDMLCAAAISGAGISMLPTFITCDAVLSGQLETVLQDHVIPPVGIYAVYPSARFLSAKVRLWIDLLADTFGDDPAWDRRS